MLRRLLLLPLWILVAAALMGPASGPCDTCDFVDDAGGLDSGLVADGGAEDAEEGATQDAGGPASSRPDAGALQPGDGLESSEQTGCTCATPSGQATWPLGLAFIAAVLVRRRRLV